jgi:DNA-binding GntR family transcriptional regulator
VETSALSVTIDRHSPVPLYFQVAQGLEAAITGGTLAPGERLENEIDLATRVGVSRPTMRRAIQHLVDAALLERHRGIGTMVLDPAARQAAPLGGLWDQLAEAGRAPRTQVLEFFVESAGPERAVAFGVEPGARIYVFTRVRFAGTEPVALLRNEVPLDLLKLTTTLLTEDGLYPLLRKAGAAALTCHKSIGARAAKGSEARLLGEEKRAPLLTVAQTSYDAGGRAVERGTHAYRPSQYGLEVTTGT